MVNLVLSNPAKKSDTSTIRDKEIVDNKVEQKPATVLKVSAPPSRAATPLPGAYRSFNGSYRATCKIVFCNFRSFR